MVSWQAFWSGLLGTTIPGLIVTLLVMRITSGFNRSLERFKVELQRDSVRFSKWHEKRVEACVAVYVAFSDFLDFLRAELYIDGRPPMSLDPLHNFSRELQKQMIFLEDGLAEKVLQYQGELLAFRNDVVSRRQAGTDFTQTKLDHEIPAYLPRLRRDINLTLDPTYDPNGSEAKTLLRFLESGQRPFGVNARGVRTDMSETAKTNAIHQKGFVSWLVRGLAKKART
ncbi:hypothetical protein AAFG13_35815 [Bradyrhizobium sp. B124]|uniref:hypothetical protein n=1 Tax=Bradyrhizobium sp. B124 TaxID=3140245 RepID=UPI003183CB53